MLVTGECHFLNHSEIPFSGWLREADEASGLDHQRARANGQSEVAPMQSTEPANGEPHASEQASELELADRDMDAQADGLGLSITKHADMKQCQELLFALQQRLSELSSHGDDNSTAGKFTGVESKSGKDQSQDSMMRIKAQLQITAALCERDWFHFMNKVASEQVEYAIEVVRGDPNYHPKHTTKKVSKKRTGRPVTTAGVQAGELKDTTKTESLDRLMPNRIRINSLSILKYLKSFDGTIDHTTPLIVLHPFKLLIHHETAIRETITHIRQQTNLPPELTLSLPTREADVDTSGASTPDEDMATRHEDLKHMEVLEEFMNKYLRPTLTRLSNNFDVKVRFPELWLLFKPGESIHMPLKIQDTSINADGIGITPETFQSRYNKLWRVTSISRGRQNIQDAHSRGADPRPNNFKVDCYYIDFHGRFFRPTVHTFEIAPFYGEVDVTSLDFYPARFLEAVPEQRTLDENIHKGRIVYENMTHSFTHFFYSGPVLMVHPCGCKMNNGPAIQEHIESEVIVDFKQALRKHPTWMPQREPWKEPVAQLEEVIENSKVTYWLNDKRKKQKRTELDQVHDDYAIDRERALTYQNEEAIFAPIPGGWNSNERMVADRDVILMPGRVYAFVLRTRTFST